VHENEARIFGEGVANCVDLMKTINSPKLRSAFDFANFVQAHEDPLANWPLLKPYSVHIHIKDARADGSVVPAGDGVGNIAPILKDAYASGYRGFLSLEPHLAAHGQSCVARMVFRCRGIESTSNPDSRGRKPWFLRPTGASAPGYQIY
jgi:sugar phosphate isomerase/epimerase